MSEIIGNPASEQGRQPPRALAWSVRGAALLGITIGAYSGIAWLTGSAARWSASGAVITMKANMSLGLVIGGLALLLLRPEQRRGAPRIVGLAAAGFVLLLGSLMLSQQLFHWDLGIDQLCAKESVGVLATNSANRTSAPGSLTLTVLGAGLLALAWGRRSLAPHFGLAACVLQLLPAVGMLYGAEELYGKPGLTNITSPTVVALFALGVGLVLARPHSGPMALLLRKDPGGALARRLFPAVILILLLLGYLRMLGQRHGLYDTAAGTGLLVIELILVLSLLFWLSAGHLSRAACAQAAAEEKLRQQNEILGGINRIFREALYCDTEEALGRTCLEVAEAVTGSKFGFIGEINAEGRLDDIAISDPGWTACKMASPIGHRIVPGGFKVHGIYGRVLADGKGFFANDPATHPDRIGCPEGHPSLKSFLGVPLIHEDKTVGMIGLGNRDGGYREEDLRALENLAPAIVQVFMRARAERQVRLSEERRKILEATTAERQRFEDVLNMLPAYVILLSPDYRVPFANRFFEQRFGKSGGRRCYEYLFNRIEPCENCETYKMLKTNAPHRWEWTGPDGRNYDIHDFLFRDRDGTILIMEMGLDITERKQAEAALNEANERLEHRVAERTAALRESEERLHFALESSHTGAWDLDLIDHTAFRSLEHDRIFGYATLLPRWTYEMFLEHVIPEDRPAVDAKFRHANATQGDWGFECRIRRADGEVRWIWAAGRHRPAGPGQSPRIAGIVQDITERRRTREQLQRAKELSEAVNRISTMLHSTFDTDQIIMGIVTEGAAALGSDTAAISIREAGGWRVRYVHGLPNELVDAHMTDEQERHAVLAIESREVVAVADAFNDERFNRDHFRQYGIRSVLVAPLIMRGKPFGVIFFNYSTAPTSFSEAAVNFARQLAAAASVALENARLFEERRQAEAELLRAKEELAQTNAALERKVQERTAKLNELVADLEHFSYTLIHDMRAPLRAIRVFSEMMGDGCTDCAREPKQFLNRITTSTERMDALITDSLNFTKAVRQELTVEPVDVRALLDGMLDSYPELQPSKADIKIEGDIPILMGNQAGLTQCLSNLLGNAVKFVAPGQFPRIRIRAERRDGWVRLWFEDNGIGIPREALPRVFDMFHRVHRNYEGTGIGLALVRKVTQRMGGRVGVESQVGVGSKFWIELRSFDGSN